MKLAKEIEDKGYRNSLDDCLLLLMNNGLGNYEAQDYIFNKWLEQKQRVIKLYGQSAVDVIIEHLKREVK